MKRLLLILIQVFLAITLNAQYYHFERGERFLNAQWYELAFREYVEGMNAGEPSSALSVVWCYLHEKGTPRDVNKAVSIMERWAEKDLGICLFTSIFFDPGRSARKLSWGGDSVFMSKTDRVDAPSGPWFGGINKIYGMSPEHAEDYRLSCDLKKAIRYAEKLNKSINSSVTQNYLYLLKEEVIKESNDIIALLSYQKDEDSVLDPGGTNYRSILSEALTQCTTLDELSKVIEIDLSKRQVLTVSDGGIYNDSYTMYLDDCYRECADKAMAFFKEVYNKYNGNLEQVKAEYDSSPQLQRVFDIGLSLAAQMYGYRDNDLDNVLWICRCVPFEKPKNTAKAVWTKCSIRDNAFALANWDAYQKVFDSDCYISVDGFVPFTEVYCNNLYNAVSKWDALKAEAARSESHSEGFDEIRMILNGQILDAERDVYYATGGMKGYNWGTISTKEEDFIHLKAFCVKRICAELLEEEKIHDMSYETYLKRVANRIEAVDVKNLQIICQRLEKDIDYMDSNPCDDATYNEMRENLHLQYSFASFLLQEKDESLSFDDYVHFAERGSTFSNYAETQLATFKKQRLTAEQRIIDRTDVDPKIKKTHDLFRATCAAAERKKLKIETVSMLKETVITPQLANCKEAYSYYPLSEKSDIQKLYEEENAVAEIILAYAVSSDALELANAFLTEYPESQYHNLVNDYYIDSYAIRKAHELSSQSTDADIQEVLALPVTKDAEKTVKALTKKSYLKNKN